MTSLNQPTSKVSLWSIIFWLVMLSWPGVIWYLYNLKGDSGIHSDWALSWFFLWLTIAVINLILVIIAIRKTKNRYYAFCLLFNPVLIYLALDLLKLNTHN